MKNNYLIIADDFTGSNDTGVQLKKNNIPVDVLLFPTKEKLEKSVVLDSESRILQEDEAYRKVKAMTANLLAQNNFSLVYKKIDSTLRGNVAKEIRAVMEAYQPEIVLVAPAFPKIGRTTKNGTHYLNGTALMKTEIANDPLTPIWTDNLENLVRREFSDSIAHYTTAELKSTNTLKNAVFHLFDAEADSDLQKIKELAIKDTRKILYVGSAGLAEYLFTPEEQPSLAVVGSISEVSLTQMNPANKQGFTVISIEINDLINKNCIEKYTDLVKKSLAQQQETILTVTRKKEDYHQTIQLFESLGISDRLEISRIIKETLATITKNVLEEQAISQLFLTGGDTAIEIIHQLEANGCMINEELFTGIVASSLVGGPFEGLKVITKAGAFGSEEAIYASLRKNVQKEAN